MIYQLHALGDGMLYILLIIDHVNTSIISLMLLCCTRVYPTYLISGQIKSKGSWTGALIKEFPWGFDTDFKKAVFGDFIKYDSINNMKLIIFEWIKILNYKNFRF